MNSKLLTTFSAVAIALIAVAPLSKAVVYSPSQFNTELKAKIGSKKGPSAYNAAANFYAKALKDKKNKKNAAKYANSIVKILKKKSVVKIALQGKSMNTQIKALLKGYFKGLKFNLDDKIYNKALDTFIKKLPTSQKTAVNSQAIYNSIKTYATKKGTPQDTVYQYYLGVASQFLLPEPPVS